MVAIDSMAVASFGNHTASAGRQERRAMSDRQLQAALDTIPGLVWLAGVDGAAEYLNCRWLEYTGLSQTQAVGWGWTAAIHPADVNQLTDVWLSVLKAGVRGEAEARLRRFDGEYRWFMFTAEPFHDESGAVAGWCGTNLDIDDRRRAEDKVRHSEACLAEAQHLSHTGSFGCKLSNGEMFWSEETFRIFEYDRRTKPSVEAVLARVHPDEKTMVQTHMDVAKRNGTACDLEYRLLLPGGVVKRVRVVAHPRREKPEDFDFVGAVMDITEQWQARTRLEQALDEIKLLKDQLYEENLALRDEVDRASMFEEIVGTSQALRHALSLAVKVAPTTSSVLITGETGTGKERIARAIHKCSARPDRPFVAVNCAALPSSLISSELFGHEKGAFTGAIRRRLGRFELAHGGTLFLDEIGDLPLNVQIALLRVLQEKEFERVGGTQTIRADVRVIAATNRDLEAAVASGAFRSDLLYRLNVFPIDVPPLRERKEDVELLLQYFVRRFATEAGKTFDRIDKRTVELFQAYDWPGNIRELQNVVERSVIVSPPGVFRVDDAWLSRSANGLARRYPIEDPTDDAARERKLIEAALAETRGRVSGPQGAAAKLRIPSTTLDYKIKRLRIRKSRFKLDSFSKPTHS